MPHERGGDKRRKPHSRVWGRHSPTSFRKGQNERQANFGTAVETCSVTAADCPCLVFSYIERTEQGLRPAVGGLFSFPLKIHFKGRQLPAGRGFFKISFASVMRESEFWQPAGQRIFLSLPTPPHFEICQTKRLIFSLLPTTDKNQKCQTPGKKNFSFTYYYNLNRAKWPETEPGNKKSSKSFSDLLLSLAAGGRLVFSFSAYRSKRNLNRAAISCCFICSSTSALTFPCTLEQ